MKNGSPVFHSLHALGAAIRLARGNPEQAPAEIRHLARPHLAPVDTTDPWDDEDETSPQPECARDPRRDAPRA